MVSVTYERDPFVIYSISGYVKTTGFTVLMKELFSLSFKETIGVLFLILLV